MAMFIDKYPDMLVYEAGECADYPDEIVQCACGHMEYKYDCVLYDGELYCSEKCKEKAILAEAGDDDIRAFVLDDWGGFTRYIESDDCAFIRETLDDDTISVKELWEKLFREYTKCNTDTFADYIEHREAA